MTPENFKKIPIVLNALSNPSSPRSILNYMCDILIKDKVYVVDVFFEVKFFCFKVKLKFD